MLRRTASYGGTIDSTGQRMWQVPDIRAVWS